jgi:hypothetical protein
VNPVKVLYHAEKGWLKKTEKSSGGKDVFPYLCRPKN